MRKTCLLLCLAAVLALTAMPAQAMEAETPLLPDGLSAFADVCMDMGLIPAETVKSVKENADDYPGFSNHMIDLTCEPMEDASMTRVELMLLLADFPDDVSWEDLYARFMALVGGMPRDEADAVLLLLSRRLDSDDDYSTSATLTVGPCTYTLSYGLTEAVTMLTIIR